MSKSIYEPVIYQLPIQPKNKSILNEKPTIIHSKFQSEPMFKLGFNHFAHPTKEKLSIINKVKLKKELYYVANEFEASINSYEGDIQNNSLTYFSTNIVSNNFYSLWEILLYFNLLPNDSTNITTVNISDTSGVFTQATMCFRDKFSTKNKSDQYYCMFESNEDNLTDLEDKFIKYYSKEKPKNFILSEDKSILQFTKELIDQKINAELITANGELQWFDKNYQEQESYRLILNEIISALNLQAKNGNFVCRFFETFTNISIKLILILQEFYTNVIICKPLMSRKFESERYVIAIGFKYAKSNELQSKIDILEKISNEMNKFELENKFTNDIFSEYEIPKDYLSVFKTLNNTIYCSQFETINNIDKYIKSDNFMGDEYHKYQEKQILATTYWLKTFYPITKNDFAKNAKEIQKNAEFIIIKNRKKVEEDIANIIV